MAYLQEAIAQGWEEDYRRVFVAHGALMGELLTAARQQGIASHQATELLELIGKQHQTDEAIEVPSVAQLSEAEVAILQLVARGLSNQQIATARTVTLNTVKWHLKNIYSKLRVSSRTAAVACARNHNWI
jgi:LuxR family maltose regulon positive regulatory protein